MKMNFKCLKMTSAAVIEFGLQTNLCICSDPIGVPDRGDKDFVVNNLDQLLNIIFNDVRL